MPDLLKDFPETPGSTAGGDAFQVAVYALVSMLVLVGISYLFSKIMRNRKLEDWSKDELVQVLINAALVGGLVLLFAPQSGIIVKVFDSLVPSETISIPVWNASAGNGTSSVPVNLAVCPGVTSGSVLCFAYGYLFGLETQIVNLVGGLLITSTLLDIIAKIAIDLIIVEITPFGGLTSIVQVINASVQSLMFLGAIVGAEVALLVFIDFAALKVFLPLGVVLRCFFGTRRLGGMLIALALGTYFVFPLSIALNAIAVQGAMLNSFDPLIKLFTTVQGVSPSSTSVFGSANPMSSDVWKDYMASSAKQSQALIDAIGAVPTVLITAISMYVVQIIFLPVLSIMITVIAIKEMAGLFGSEVNLSKFEV